jgi:hypothetical protein
VRTTEYLTQQSLHLDVGQDDLGPAQPVWVWAGYRSWKNKFGISPNQPTGEAGSARNVATVAPLPAAALMRADAIRILSCSTDDGEVPAECGQRFCRQSNTIGGTCDQDLLVVHGTQSKAILLQRATRSPGSTGGVISPMMLI